MLSREEIAKYTLEETDKLTYGAVVKWLIDEIYMNEQSNNKIKSLNEIIETQRRRIKKLLEKKGEQQ